MAGSGIVVQGLAEFRAAVRASAAKMPPTFAVALKKASVPILAQISATAPGRVGSTPKAAVAGARASIVSSLPFMGGAEWGQFGKWQSWVAKYGPPPRFVWPAVEQHADEVALIVLNELRDVIDIQGWAT